MKIPRLHLHSSRSSIIKIAVEVWNRYFAPVIGVSDSPLLAIYSHMVDGPLYLQNYAYGQIIQFQIEDHLKGKDFSDEIDRMYSSGPSDSATLDEPGGGSEALGSA
ncbi:MAG: hypothetical protein MZV63_00485 [Marinilabiliales bacterium]|nr:hypothetical protein [Marinilabiliales bacterium]